MLASGLSVDQKVITDVLQEVFWLFQIGFLSKHSQQWDCNDKARYVLGPEHISKIC